MPPDVIRGRARELRELGEAKAAAYRSRRAGTTADGIVSGGAVVCPLHGWKITLQNGAVERPCETAGRVETYPVRIDNGLVVIGLPADFGGRIDEATEHAATVCGLQEVNSCG